MSSIPHSCRLSGATSYRRVIARDEAGAMRAAGLYQCSGCSVVFADPRAWRAGEPDDLGREPPIHPLTPTGLPGPHHMEGGPNLSTYGPLFAPPHPLD